MTMRTLISSFGLGLALMSAPLTAQPNSYQGRDDVIGVREGDKAMNVAIAKARKELPNFLKHLQSPGADEGYFSVKFNLTPDGDAEFIWANNLSWNDGRLQGSLSNVPIANGFSQGQSLLIPLDQIVDWGYFKGDVMQGNYTTRVLLEMMPAEDAAKIRQAFGW